MRLQTAGTDFLENLGAANIEGKAKVLHAVGLLGRGQHGQDMFQGQPSSHVDASILYCF
jgi:hypothetical protein